MARPLPFPPQRNTGSQLRRQLQALRRFQKVMTDAIAQTSGKRRNPLDIICRFLIRSSKLSSECPFSCHAPRSPPGSARQQRRQLLSLFNACDQVSGKVQVQRSPRLSQHAGVPRCPTSLLDAAPNALSSSCLSTAPSILANFSLTCLKSMARKDTHRARQSCHNCDVHSSIIICVLTLFVVSGTRMLSELARYESIDDITA